MPYDDVAWEQSDDISDSWLLQLLEDIEVKRAIAEFTYMHDKYDDMHESGNNDLTAIQFLGGGSFNFILQMEYKHSATNIRFSKPGVHMFPEEKVKNEVAVMRYISNKTCISVPVVLKWGTKEECPLKLSPFIIMSHIEHKTLMYHVLNRPGCPRDVRGILNPNIDEDQLEMLYIQLAKILLQLSKTELPKIGSLSQVDDLSWEVARRPLSMNMNELVQLGTLPRSKLPPLHTTFETASSYIETLAQLNIQHLIHQRNDAVQSADDCRRKYVARQLFYKLARDKKLTLPCYENGPFKLWCDDFRPANVLLNEDMHIAGVVDWEFTYAAPVEFSYAAPWWLLIEKPEYWSEGINDWTRIFDRRLKTFLTAMRHCEDMDDQQGPCRLSDQMEWSWESGDFWVVYAILNSFAFDAIYWQKIDRRFFGTTETDDPDEAWKERLDLLDETQRDEMERLVTRKLEEMEERVLAWDPDEYTEAFRQELRRKREQQAQEEQEEQARETED